MHQDSQELHPLDEVYDNRMCVNWVNGRCRWAQTHTNVNGTARESLLSSVTICGMIENT